MVHRFLSMASYNIRCYERARGMLPPLPMNDHHNRTGAICRRVMSDFRAGCMTIFFGLMFFSATVVSASADEEGEKNRAVILEEDGSIVLRWDEAESVRFRPSFTVIFSPSDPDMKIVRSDIPWAPYNYVTWFTGEATDGREVPEELDDMPVGDGWDPRVLRADTAGRTPDYFHAGFTTSLTATSAVQLEDRVEWEFPDREDFELTARIEFPEEGSPVLRFRFVPRRSGWYSVGYTGAPAVAAEDADEIWQPLIWTGKRFPDRSYLTLAFRCPLPVALVSSEGRTVGVLAEVDEFPFQPLPRPENSRFGVMVRNSDGKAQPALFAPVLGGMESEMDDGDPFSFSVRLVAQPGSISLAHERIARNYFGFQDYRQNTMTSLNETLENMVAYAMSDYAQFDKRLRGSSYATDVEGTVNNVSSLHPLSAALIMDREDFYWERAVPIMEALLSRERRLFTTDPAVTGQGATTGMGGPAAMPSELAALYGISGRRSPVFYAYAKRNRNAWWTNVALFRATGEGAYLERAKVQADGYLEQRRQDPANHRVGFFTTYSRWIALYDLYQETGEKRFLEAAVRGAREYAQFVWMSPRIPDEEIVVNEGGEAPVYWYLERRTEGPIPVPEERVPAWRVSEVGLTAESTGTSNGHRGIFLASPAPWLLRMGWETDDRFLHDIARSAVIGRYSNFPGYHMNTARTTVYEKPDYPLRPFSELSYNSFHYNHIWSQIAMVLDYLVSDASIRSFNKISFPGYYAEGYGYIQSKIYGARPGRFYDDDGVWLWMPDELLKIDSVQANYIAARGDESLYIALTNQSFEPIEVEVEVNESLVPIRSDRAYAVRVWDRNGGVQASELRDGRIRLPVAARGITAFAIDGVEIEARFQHKVGEGRRLSENSFVDLDFEGATAMVISMGPELTHAYVYLRSRPGDLHSAVLRYREDAHWKTLEADSFPHEFSVPLTPDANGIELIIETLSADRERRRSDPITLEL